MKRSIGNILGVLSLVSVVLSFACMGCAGNGQIAAEQSDNTSEAEAPDSFEEAEDGLYEPVLPVKEEEASIYVEKIDGLPDDFIKGVDISTILVQEESGAKYYNEEGKEEDIFKILADAGVNYVRVRVWNDPYDTDGHGYGGGNCDRNTAAEIGKRAAEYGMKLCVDFHYSDFWADPNKQMCPKAWEGMDINEKSQALYDFTKEALEYIISEGADVEMVQIGNEINHGLSGETDLENKIELLKSGSRAVRDVSAAENRTIKVVVHYTEIDDTDGILKTADELKAAELDFDVFGVSYYTYWHGNFENMQEVLSEIKSGLGVDTCIMETAYLFTEEDGDNNGNSVNSDEILPEYPASVQGQANNLRDVMSYAFKAGSVGVFYWEPAWVPVDNSTWERLGSGWATSYAAEYDPDDAGKYYGGSAWDNQGLFDFDGKMNASLNVFKYVNYGAKAAEGQMVIAVPDIDYEVGINSDFTLPEEVPAIYNDSTCDEPAKVKWENPEDLNISVADTYIIKGVAADKFDMQATVKVSNKNYLLNPGFEDADTSMWEITSKTGENPCDFQDKEADAKDGTIAFHFWSDKDMDFALTQKLENLPAGRYAASAYLQGGDAGADDEIVLVVTVDDKEYVSDNIKLTGWVDWHKAELKDIEIKEGSAVTVEIRAKCKANAWGTIDSFEFYCMQ